MRPNALRQVFAERRTAVNGWVSGDSPYLAEVLSHSGFDAVTIDLQHGMFGLDGALRLLHAVSSGPTTPLVRPSSLDPALIGKLLDGGAFGVICPAIDTPEQARELVSACRYPPTGTRSFGPARALLYGGGDYVDHADDTILVMAMVESTQSFTNLEGILAVDGIDGVYVGPNDLALSLGLRPGSMTPDPEVAGALEHIVEAAHATGRVAGAFCADGHVGAWLAGLGYDLVTPGNDAGQLRAAARERIAQVRGPSGEGARVAQATGGY